MRKESGGGGVYVCACERGREKEKRNYIKEGLKLVLVVLWA